LSPGGGGGGGGDGDGDGDSILGGSAAAAAAAAAGGGYDARPGPSAPPRGPDERWFEHRAASVEPALPAPRPLSHGLGAGWSRAEGCAGSHGPIGAVRSEPVRIDYR
jgi:hypothetical protein